MDKIYMTGIEVHRADRYSLLLGYSCMFSPLRLAGVVLLACLIAIANGCVITGETKRSLAAYVQAMDQVEQSANEFLTDFSDGLKVQKELARVARAEKVEALPEYPTTFVLPVDSNVPKTKTEKALAGSQQALVAIREYNYALVALAEGHSEGEVRERAMQLGGAIETLVTLTGSSIPGLSAITEVGSKIIKLAQDAKNREQLEQAVKEGREPIGVIMTALEKQTPEMYRLSVVGTKQGQTKLKDDIRRAAFALKTFIPRHGPPADSGLAGKMAAFQKELSNIGEGTRTRGAMPIPFPYTNGKPPYDRTAHVETMVFMEAIRTSGQKYAELVAKQNAYYYLMSKYVATLRQTWSSLDLVAASLTKPVDLRSEVDRLLKVAFELRDAMAEFRNP